MHGVALAENGGAPPTENLLSRGRQARLRRRAVMTGGVAAAVAASDNTSYRVKVTWGCPGREPAETVEGAFDPASRTGYLNSKAAAADVVYLERLVDGVRFVSSSGSEDVWKQYPDTHDRLNYDNALDGAASASEDPEALFDTLVAKGAVITQTGAGFHFEVTVSEEVSLAGDVTLGADKRIASVSYEETTRIPKRDEVAIGRRSVTVTLSDYGTPVQVERPTDVVVK